MNMGISPIVLLLHAIGAVLLLSALGVAFLCLSFPNEGRSMVAALELCQ